MDLSLTATTWGLMGRSDGTSINTNSLTCTWKVEMKMRDNIKEEGGNETRGSKKKKKENYSSIKN